MQAPFKMFAIAGLPVIAGVAVTAAVVGCSSAPANANPKPPPASYETVVKGPDWGNLGTSVIRYCVKKNGVWNGIYEIGPDEQSGFSISVVQDDRQCW